MANIKSSWKIFPLSFSFHLHLYQVSRFIRTLLTQRLSQASPTQRRRSHLCTAHTAYSILIAYSSVQLDSSLHRLLTQSSSDSTEVFHQIPFWFITSCGSSVCDCGNSCWDLLRSWQKYYHRQTSTKGWYRFVGRWLVLFYSTLLG